MTSILATIVFSTFIGGEQLEFAGQVAFDSQQNVIVIGTTTSSIFPLIADGSPKSVDAYVLKLTPDGSRVLWGRFLGGSRLEDTLALALDADNNIYIAGRTDSPDFPVTPNASQREFGGGTYDAYVVKLDASGQIVFATYFGGAGADAPDGLAVDGEGNIVIAGDTTSSNASGGADLFVGRFGSDGRIIYSIDVGSSASDFAHAVAVDKQGNAWVVGGARADDFPVTDALQAEYKGGGGDAVLFGLSPEGVLLTSTFIGGSGFDGGDAIAIAPDGSIWISGRSDSSDFPLRNSSRSLAGRFDTFLAKFDGSGRNLLAATFIGGSDSDFPLDLVIAEGGRPVVCGETASFDFPTRQAVQASHAGGSYDAYVTMLDAEGSSIIASTYFGGNGSENCSSVSSTGANRIAMSGASGSSNLSLVRPVRSTFANGEGYVAVLEIALPPKRRAAKSR